MFDSLIEKEFPILKTKVKKKQLVYLDNAATTLTPQTVVERMSEHYQKENANIHRGVHYLSEKATLAFEDAREQVRKFINAPHLEEVIITSGTTESINLVASSYGGAFLKTGDEIIISHLEHHSNIVPWQLVAQKTGAILKVIPINNKGEIIYEEYLKLLSPKTKVVAILAVSNALGSIIPIKKMIADAHQQKAVVLVDAAQAVAHFKVDVKDLDVDFLAFSGHKLFGPSGIGILWGRKELLEKMPPYQGGGEMISKVTFEKTTYNRLPYKFEAGTPPIAEMIGIGAAINWFNSLDIKEIQNKEKALLQKAEAEFREIPEIKIIGSAKVKASLVSFTVNNIHPHDLGTILNDEGVAIRTGHHCAQPIMDFFKISATARASFCFYNSLEDIDKLVRAIKKALKVFN